MCCEECNIYAGVKFQVLLDQIDQKGYFSVSFAHLTSFVAQFGQNT